MKKTELITVFVILSFFIICSAYASAYLNVSWISQVNCSEGLGTCNLDGSWGPTMNCGPTALVMTAHYQRGFRSPTTQDIKNLDSWLYENKLVSAINNYNLGSEGTDFRDLMAAGAYYYGFWDTKRYNLNDLNLLNNALENNHPVIIGVKTNMGYSTGNKHWMVLTGIDANNVYVNDPGKSRKSDDASSGYKGGQTSYTISQFQLSWSTQNYAAIVFEDGRGVGEYFDGWHDVRIVGFKDPPSQPFVDYYLNHGGPDFFGYPVGRVAQYNNYGYGLWSQNFPTRGYLFILNQNVYNIKDLCMGVVYSVHGQMRNYWQLHYINLGAPVTNEYYYPTGTTNNVVQWFEPSDNRYICVVYNNTNGKFSQYNSGDIGCPPLDQKYFDQCLDSNIGYSREGYGMGGGGPMLTDPTNLTAGAVSDSAIELAFNLPEAVNTGSWSVNVYQNGSFLNTCTLSSSLIVRGLTADTDYCFAVSVVDNSTGEESGLSNLACARTNPLPPSANYTVVGSTTCSAVQNSAPYDCLNTDGAFAMSPGVNIYAWSRISSSTSLNCQWRLYYQPENIRIYNAALGGPPSYIGSDLNYYNQANQTVTTYCRIEANSLPAWIGQYRVELLVNGILTKTMYFNLILSTPSKPYVISNVGDNFVRLRASTISGANIYQLYRDGSYLGNFSPDFTFTDTNLVPNRQYEYRVIAVSDNRFLSGLSSACVVTYTPAADTTPPQAPTGITIQIVP